MKTAGVYEILGQPSYKRQFKTYTVEYRALLCYL